jgi:DNA polymerase V
LQKIFRENYAYKKCGVILGGLLPVEAQAARLYEQTDPKREKLNKAIDEINRKFGKGTIHLAAATTGCWQTKRNQMSPRYTTRLDEIISIK